MSMCHHLRGHRSSTPDRAAVGVLQHEWCALTVRADGTEHVAHGRAQSPHDAALAGILAVLATRSATSRPVVVEVRQESAVTVALRDHALELHAAHVTVTHLPRDAASWIMERARDAILPSRP